MHDIYLEVLKEKKKKTWENADIYFLLFFFNLAFSSKKVNTIKTYLLLYNSTSCNFLCQGPLHQIPIAYCCSLIRQFPFSLSEIGQITKLPKQGQCQ